MKLLFIYAPDEGAYSRLHKLDDELSYAGTAGVVKDDETKSPQVHPFGSFCIAVYRDGDVESVKKTIEHYQFTVLRQGTARDSKEDDMSSGTNNDIPFGNYVTATVAPGWEREGRPVQGVLYSEYSDQPGTAVVRCLSGDFVCLKAGMTLISEDDLPEELHDHLAEVSAQIRRRQRIGKEEK